MRLAPTYKPAPLAAAPVASAGLPSDWVSVLDYGAIGDNSTDDTAAFLLARDTGANVYIPGGLIGAPLRYNISSTITLKETQEFLMGGVEWGAFDAAVDWANYYGFIQWLPATGTCFNLNYSSRITGVRIMQGATPTAGSHFNIGSLTRTIVGAQLIRCSSYGAWAGFRVGDLCGHNVLTENVSNASVYSGYEIDCASPNGDLRWTSNTSLQDKVGVRVRQCDTSKILGMTVKAAFDHSIYYMADKGVIDQLNFLGADLEDCQTGQNVVELGGNAYGVTRCNLSDLEILGSISPDGCGTIKLNSNVTDCTINIPMGMYCKYLDYGSRNTLTNSNFTHGGASLTAVDLYGADSIVIGNTARGYAAGLNLRSGATYPTIIGNNFRTNTAVMTLDGTAKATGRGVGNIGVTDW